MAFKPPTANTDHPQPGSGQPNSSLPSNLTPDATPRVVRSPEVTSALLAAIVESSDDAILSFDLDGIITSWNNGAERIFGYPWQETIGQPTSILASDNALEDTAVVLERIRQGQRVEHYETLRRHKDGSDLMVSLSVSPVRDASGTIIGASKVARDITATRRAEQALRNADKLALAGRMAASIAHEINNPLEAITNLLYLLDQESGLSEQGRGFLGLAQHELMRVSHITSQTLGFFRSAPGPIQCQIAEIVDNAVALHAGRLVVSEIAVETRFHPVPPLLCHQGELRQVIVNLISNALDSIPGKGRLLLRIRQAAHPLTSAPGIRLTVADTGSGMKQRTVRQIFEPFFTTKGATGTGLGLWVTHQIIDRHAGQIAVRSLQSPFRHGTVFSIFLPLANPAFQAADSVAQKPAEAPAATAPEGGFRHIPSAPGSPSAAYNVA